MSKLFSDRYRDDSEFSTAPNLYLLTIASSGSGKSTGIDFVNEAVLHMKFENKLSELRNGEQFMANITSRVAFCLEFERNRTASLQRDEASEFLGSTTGNGRNPCNVDLVAFLKEIFTMHKNPEYLIYRSKESEITLRNPSPTVLFYTTNGMIQQNVDISMIEGGLMGRFLIFKGWGSDENRRQLDDAKNKGGLPSRVKKWIGDVDRSLFDSMLDDDGVLRGSSNQDLKLASQLDDEPEILCRSDEVVREFNACLDVWDKWKVDAPILQEAMWARAAEKVSKLAILFACSRA